MKMSKAKRQKPDNIIISNKFVTQEGVYKKLL